MSPRNIFELPPDLRGDSEIYERLAEGKSVVVERIISTGQVTPDGKWFDQKQDEWVVLMQGEATIAYSNGPSAHLKAGDYVFIPAHVKHRVEYTSADPPCIWLAIHAAINECSS